MTEETKLFIQETEMPASCSDCYLLYDQISCIVTGEGLYNTRKRFASFNEETDIMPGCPLRTLESMYARGYNDGSKNTIRALVAAICEEDEI